MKTKCVHSDTFVIIGYQPTSGAVRGAGGVERGVGRRDEIAAAAGGGDDAGNAETGRHDGAVTDCGMRDGGGKDVVPDTIGDRIGIGGIDAGQQDQHLLAAEPERGARAADDGVAYATADRRQAVVTFEMSATVVEEFEMIDVEQDGGHAARLGICPKRRVQIVQVAAIEQTRQSVGLRAQHELLMKNPAAQREEIGMPLGSFHRVHRDELECRGRDEKADDGDIGFRIERPRDVGRRELDDHHQEDRDDGAPKADSLDHRREHHHE